MNFKNLLAIILLITLNSCSTFKSFVQDDKSKKDTKTEVIETTKKGGVTTLIVPNIIRKDTTITSINYENKTILTTTFKKDGSQQIECLESEIKEKITRIEEAIQKDIQTKREVKKEFNPQHIFYAIGVLIFIIIIGLVVFLIVFINVKKSIPSIISEIVK